MSSYVFDLNQLDKTNIALVGGKAANLGELRKIKGIHVPHGFCITTDAFGKVINESSTFKQLVDQLSELTIKDRDKTGETCNRIRTAIEETFIPQDIHNDILHLLSKNEDQISYAVRSSATAEDLPNASFAGQQDTYLNIIGKDAILKHINKCWASLFTERAVIYRIQNNFDHRKVQLAVIIQKMIFPHSSGIMFTADPVTSNRKVLSIDAGFGLGEAIVSGLVNADHYKVESDKIVEKKISTKHIAIFALSAGGTKQREIEADEQTRQALTDQQIVELGRIGRTIEKHFGCPQDIEWCLSDDVFYIVQSRPITTLFPIPFRQDNQKNHVYVSVGHQQMMTDPFKPLGLSLFQLTAARPMFPAAGRLFVDVTDSLVNAQTRNIVLTNLGHSDPLIKDALLQVLKREDFITLEPEDKQEKTSDNLARIVLGAPTTIKNDTTIVDELIRNSKASLEAFKEKMQTKSGSEVFDAILEDLQQLRKSLFDSQSMAALMAAINASAWINTKMDEWLGEKKSADTLAQSVSNNVTSEMGLALLDVADVIRPFPEVIQYLENTTDDNFLDALGNLTGGHETTTAIRNYLDLYGMRCVGEIDITRTRWSEKPRILLPIILSNIKNFKKNAGHLKFDQGLEEALKKEQSLLQKLKQLPDGQKKAEEAREQILFIRNFAGYREYPKYEKINRYFVYKQGIMKEVTKLVTAGLIREKEDAYYLTFEELQQVVRTHNIDYQIIEQRKKEYKSFEKLTPSRVITSDGEIIRGSYNREDFPAGAIVGLAVSSGVIEGRARVIMHIEDAIIEDGDILVTAFTDPSWTPLFVSISGLVTEVGGLMTHGAVIAREYGLPAIVGVENATKLIRNGDRIRLDGTEGYVEIL